MNTKRITHTLQLAAAVVVGAIGVLPIVLLASVAFGFLHHPYDSTVTGNLEHAALWRSVVYAVTASALQTALAILLMSALFSGAMDERPAFVVWAVVPYALSPLATAYIWKIILSQDGPLSSALDFLGAALPPLLTPEPLFGPIRWAHLSIFLVDCWTWLPLMTIVLLFAALQVPPSLVHSAYLEGGSTWRVLTTVIFPRIWRPLIWIWLLRFVDSVRLFDAPWVLSKLQNDLIPFAVAAYDAGVSRSHFSSAAQLSVAALAVSLIALGATFWLDRRAARY